jgi:hypothetical protein
MIDTKSPISVLDLNTRAMNAIRRHTEIKTVEELISYDRGLLYLPEISKVTFAHIQEKLAEHNLYLQSDKRKIEMNGLREIEITFTVKVATYNPQKFIDSNKEILDSYMGITFDIIRSNGITDDGKLIISGDMK